MRTLTRHLLASLLVLACGAAAAGPTPAPVKVEIDTLLSRLQASGCQFNRNGSWYTGAEAKDHLARKLEYLEGKMTLQNSEQFIELAATKSSMSGKAYQVKCNGQAPVESQTWLTQQLASLRQAPAKAKP